MIPLQVSPPWVASTSVAFGLSKPEAEKRKSLKKIQSLKHLKKKKKKIKKIKEKKKRGKKKKQKGKKKNKNQIATCAGSQPGSDFHSFWPACALASVCPSRGEPSPSARPAPASLRARIAAQLSGCQHHLPRCPLQAPTKTWFPLSRAAVTVNLWEPWACIYRETQIPKAAVSAASDCLLTIFCPL